MSGYSRWLRNSCKALPWISFLLVLPVSAIELGQCPASNPRGFPYAKAFTGNRIAYRVNAVSFDALPSIGRNAGVTAVALGADTWNEQSTAADFYLSGSTSLASLPDTIEACNAQGVDASLVTVSNVCLTGGYARTFGRCWRTGTGDAQGWTRFEMIIHTQWRPTSADVCEPIPWSVGAAQADRLDLASVTTHEFGHALDVGHAPDGYWSIMTPGAYGTNRDRDLYLWDVECAGVIAGSRKLKAYHRFHFGGVLQAEQTSMIGDAHTPQAAVGVLQNPGGTWSWAAASRLWWNNSYYWDWGLGSLDPIHVLSEPSGLGITIGTTHEEPTWARLFWPKQDEWPRYQWTATHSVKYKFSDDGFATSGRTGELVHCRNMIGWMQCAPTWAYYEIAVVQTAKPLAVAWDNLNQRTVFAWVHQDRDYAPWSRNRDVKIAFGYIGHIQGAWMLPQPDDAGVKSSVSPGVACSAGRAAGYDCILAYVDDTDPLASVRIKRFSGRQGAYRYELVAEPGSRQLMANVRTASRIAAWYHDNNFYIAIRPIRTGQQLEVFQSVDGATWTVVVGAWTGAYTTTGPSAASTWAIGNNVLMYMR